MMDYHRQNQVDIRISRIFNTYGPQMSINDGRVVSNFIVQALRGEPLTIYGDGSQTRSFCYVSDLIRALEQLMACDGVHRPINLGNPVESTISFLAERIREATGSGSEIKFESLPQDDPTRRNPDISEARRLLGWEPQVDLEDGLRLTIEYFEALLRK